MPSLGDDPYLYGLNLDYDEIINIARTYLARPQLDSTIWELQDLRNKMKR